MTFSSWRSTVAVLALGCMTAATAAKSPLEDSFTEARAVLARAMTAHGGIERIQALQAVKLDLKGQISIGTQGRSAAAVSRTLPEGEFETHVAIDFDKSRSRTAGDQRGNDGMVFSFIAIYRDGAVNVLTPYPPQNARTEVADFDTGRDQTAGIGTRMTVPAVLKLAAQRLASLRSEGEGRIDGHAVQRISFNMDKATRVTLSVDRATGRVLALEQLAPDPLLGLDTTRYTYVGTQTIAGLVLPQRAVVTRRGITILDIAIGAARFDADAAISDADFAIDDTYKRFDPPALEVTEVRPGLWEVANAGQGTYRVQFVELADRLIAYDAPVSPAEVQAVIAKLREKVPGKRISHVVLSHFHDDHAGGVRGFAEAGATIVTTADVQPIVKRYAEARMTSTTLVDTPAPALTFALVKGQLELGDATRRVTAVATQGDPHVDHLLVLVDGGSKAVMTADAYSDTMPFNAVFDWTAQWIQANQPQAELLLGAHHPPTAMGTLLTRQAEYRAAGKKVAGGERALDARRAVVYVR